MPGTEMLDHARLIYRFFGDAFDGPGTNVSFTTPAEHERIVAGRHSIYYDRGVVPLSPDDDGILQAAICPAQFLRETVDWTDEMFNGYLMYWSMRLKLRLTQQVELGSLAGERAPELLVEEMVESQMLAAGLYRWWEEYLRDQD